MAQRQLDIHMSFTHTTRISVKTKRKKIHLPVMTMFLKALNVGQRERKKERNCFENIRNIEYIILEIANANNYSLSSADALFFPKNKTVIFSFIAPFFKGRSAEGASLKKFYSAH